MLSPSAAKEQILKIKKSMPHGSTLDFRVEDDQLWLNIIRVPLGSPPGTGSRILARLLEVADRARCSTLLEADPCDEPGEPETFDLVRWYQSFGFKRQALTEDGVLMLREPGEPCAWEKLLSKAKSEKRLNRSEFDSWITTQEEIIAREDSRNTSLQRKRSHRFG